MNRLGLHIPLLLLVLLALASFPVFSQHHVTVVDHAFQPSTLTIQQGESVTWTNQGGQPHNVVADDGSFRCAESCGGAGAAPSAAAWSSTVTFNQAGVFGYYCEIHGGPGAGMAGTIIVLGGNDNGDNGGDDNDFAINFGLTGSWFNRETSGQGFLFDVVAESDPPQVVAYWFTYTAAAGGPESRRWFIAQGPFEEGDSGVALDVLMVTGGAFDQTDQVEHHTVGIAELEFESCTEATLAYDINLDGDESANVSGVILLERLSPDVMCETLAEGD